MEATRDSFEPDAGADPSVHLPAPPPDEPDYYWDNGRVVFTAAYHLRRGSCCGSGCRHCPYGNAPSE